MEDRLIDLYYLTTWPDEYKYILLQIKKYYHLIFWTSGFFLFFKSPISFQLENFFPYYKGNLIMHYID